ncbi:MAG TPA: response regulator [Thermoanaerobaculia bacterium]|nr:response regulator [Thermoanaerobaculia bacterium]
MDKPLVLLADDNEATCTLITALLQRDFVVHVAGDGNEAIERLKTTQYSAILLDLLMPVVDGYAVLDFLRAERPELLQQVLVVTASLAAREMQRLNDYQVRRVIPKPFEVDVLYYAVRECAGLPGSQNLRGSLISGGMLLLLAEVLRV